MQPACTYAIFLAVVFCAFAALTSIFLGSLKRVLRGTSPQNWRPGSMVENSWVAKFPRYQLTVHLSSLRLSEVLATPYKGTKLHMARNIFYIHEMVIKVIQVDFDVPIALPIEAGGLEV